MRALCSSSPASARLQSSIRQLQSVPAGTKSLDLAVGPLLWFLCFHGAAVNLPPPLSWKMRKTVHLHDWAWKVAADTYRLNLFSQLTGRTTPKEQSVNDDQRLGARMSARKHHEGAGSK